MIITSLVFLLTYVLISLRKFRAFSIERPAVALFGATLMILFGVISPEEAFSAIELHTLALLLGMMIIVATLEICGFFNLIAVFMIKHSKNQFQFLLIVMITTAVL